MTQRATGKGKKAKKGPSPGVPQVGNGEGGRGEGGERRGVSFAYA